MLWKSIIPTDTCSLLKWLGQNYLCLPIRRTQVTIWFLSSSNGRLAWKIYQEILQQDLHWKGISYDLIFIIINRLIKMINYKLVQIRIGASGLAKVFIDLVARHHNFPNLIVSNWDPVFTSKFWSFQYHFQVRLQLLPMHLLWEHQLRTL